MAKKKDYYAVKVGRVPGIYRTWPDCQAQTSGISGALYKSFFTLEEAEAYLSTENNAPTSLPDDVAPQSTFNVSQFNTEIDQRIADLPENESIAFVDGSYDSTGEKVSFGAIIFNHGGNKTLLYKAFTKQMREEFVSHHNVSGELEGVKEAISWAIQYKKEKILVCYDYSGIEEWATGAWKAHNEVTKDYADFIEKNKNSISITFQKVPAHSGVIHNEEVDALAKNALLAKGHKTYNDGSVYFVGFGVEDWKAIIACINDENSCLENTESIAPLVLTSTQIGTKEVIKISQGKNTVTINCYKNYNSYVQGKQTALLEKILATAIELLKSSDRVVETLSSYHALTLTPTEVENRFSLLIPNYRHESDKHYANLLSAVYNTMITGYLPDYTSLVTPIFRAYEYYLHRILGDIMELDTETANGKNKFSYFTRNTSGKFECTASEKAMLTQPQLDYLNKLYTTYNSVRHPYSHWSACDISTAVIDNINIARSILTEGLYLVNQYYTLF